MRPILSFAQYLLQNKSLLTIIFVTLILNGNAQVNIIATNGNGGPYATLKAAFDEINSGTFTGNVQIIITGNTFETASAVLNASGTGASYTSITIKPSGGLTRTIGGFVAGPLIDLNGADNVTIDGLNTEGDGLIISNSSASNLTTVSTIRFINDASYNTVINTTILGSGTSNTSGTILFSTALNTGNNNNSITHCSLDAAGNNLPVTAIVCRGSTTSAQLNKEITISNCNISNFFHPSIATAGIYVIQGGTLFTIFNNKFYQTAPRTYTGGVLHFMVNIASGDGHSLINNVFGYASPFSSGRFIMNSSTFTSLAVIQLSVGNGQTTSVQGNIISAIDMTSTRGGGISTAGVLCGINVLQGAVDIGTITGNTVGSNYGTGAILLTSSSGTIVGIHSASTGAVQISNNTIGGLLSDAGSSFSSYLAGINISGAASSLTISNNIIGNATPLNMTCGQWAGSTAKAYGIQITAAAVNQMISGNLVQNYSVDGLNGTLIRGIYCTATGTQDITISDNIIRNMTTVPSGTYSSSHDMTMQGITVEGGTNVIISNNQVSNLELTDRGLYPYSLKTAAVAGIGVYNGINTIISGNKIWDLKSNAPVGTSGGTYPTVSGILTHGATSGVKTCSIYNNMISLGEGETTNTIFMGIWNRNQQGVQSGLFTTKIFFNSVYIAGTNPSGDMPSFAFTRGGLGWPTTHPIEIRNNIFVNARTGGTGKHFAISNNYETTTTTTGWVAGASDYNVLKAPDAMAIGYWAGIWDMAIWKYLSSSDSNSVSAIPVNFINTSVADLHLAGSSIGDQLLGGVTIPGITTDYDNEPRDAVKPYKGADEAQVALPLSLLYFKGNKLHQANQLSWKTTCDIFPLQFQVQRSKDAAIFTSITTFNGSPQQCIEGFSYIDRSSEPLSYYRLKISTPGSTYYSPVISIANNSTLPGVSIKYITSSAISLNLDASVKQVNVLITDVTGRILIQKQVLNAGAESLIIPIDRLPAGLYYCTSSWDGNKKTISFVK